MRIEHRNMDGCGDTPHEVYDMPPPLPTSFIDGAGEKQHRDPYYWDAVTDVPCPVDGCDQTVVWYEAGYVPGYRVCMRRIEGDKFDYETLRHRLQAGGTAEAPTLTKYEIAEVDETT